MKIFLILVVVIGVLVLVVASRPSEFSITRSAVMSAPAQKVFEQVNDFHKWEAWSPWAKMDPNAKNTFSGAASGTGAGFRWEGNNDVGVGSMLITESVPGETIRIKLAFEKPFAATNETLFTFKEQGGQTTVTWTMSGKNNFIGKAMSLVMNCDKMVGGQFEKGLANMKALAEKA